MKKKGLLGLYFGSNLLLRVMIGLIAGVVVGLALGYGNPAMARAFAANSAIFGSIFIRLLKMIVIPVIFFSLIGGAASIAPARLGRIGVKIIVFYMLTSAISTVFGLLFANLLHPGSGMDLAGAQEGEIRLAEAPQLTQVLLNIIPTNPIQSLAEGDVLPIIFFALVFGLSISFLKESDKPQLARNASLLHDIVDTAAEVMYKIVRGIMQYAPIGVFFLIAIVFAEQGAKALGPLVTVTLTAYLASIVVVIVGYGSLLTATHIGFWNFLRAANSAIICAFVTRSSSGTLPVSMRVCEEKLGIPRHIYSFTLPLGATINMNGTAIYLGVCAMFIGYATGSPLDIAQQIKVVTTATLAAIGTAGVPGSGAIMLLMVLNSIGLRLDAGSAAATAYAMILGIDALLDMCRTSLNVTGDIVCTAILAQNEKKAEGTVEGKAEEKAEES